MPYIDVRPDAGIVRSPLDEIKAIQTLLADVYKDAGDGRTLFRELVQNADDACAHHLALTVLERGWPNARNSLLGGPALLVANDGAFPDEDREALHKAIGGSKEDDVDKIGTFGIGLKSVFHICEAFLYIGAKDSEWRAGVLNPWVGTGENEGVDPLHPDWDDINAEEADRLRSVIRVLLGPITDGLLLWIPLRTRDHLNRGAGRRPYGLGENRPKLDDLRSWFRRSEPAALLLAQCGHLQTIETNFAAVPESMPNRHRLMHVERHSMGWVGRHLDDGPRALQQPFYGEIASEGSSWNAVGIDAVGSPDLHGLRSRDDWPQSSQWRNGQYSTIPRKALAHAAVTVLRPLVPVAELKGMRLRWAVFLPLDDDPEPVSSAIVERDGLSPAWEIILHGYFWPSQDRRSIPGVTDESGDTAVHGDMRTRWNSTLCEELLLPLLPSTLAKAVVGVEQSAARSLLEAVARSTMVTKRLAFITNRHWLLPTIASDGVRWKALDAKACSVLSIPKWNQAPHIFRRLFVADCAKGADDVVFVDHDAPRFAGELDEWTVDCLQGLLNSIPADEFSSPESLRWIERFVRHVLGPDACSEDSRAAVISRWLVQSFAHGALSHTISRSTSRESRDELRGAWIGLCEALPTAWLLETPVESLHAVVELAAEDAIGSGLFLVPFGRRRSDAPPASQFDQQRLDVALSALGRRLEAGNESDRLRHSRLLLAETLLTVRHERSMGDRLLRLPLLRAIRLPDDREEAWSIFNLRHQIDNCRVFASLLSDDHDADGFRSQRLSDPKQAVAELADALGESIWLVNGDALAAVAAAPLPTPKALATAVLEAKRFAEPARRTHLLNRLTPSIPNDDDVRFAARTLLAGCTANVVGPDTELFHGSAAGGQALRILLRLLDQSWRAVESNCVESISSDLANALSVSRADLEVLHRLLDECLEQSVDWSSLTHGETLHLLKHLYSPEPEVQRRWSAIPLHRDVDGNRAAFSSHARRSTGSRAKLRLPPELGSEVRLLKPDSEVAHLYASVPEMDDDGILQLMLEGACPWRFADRIVQSVRSADGQVTLPRAPGLRELMRHRRWLPHRDHGGLAPDAVLVAPKEVLHAVAELAKYDSFGDKRLPNAVDPSIWPTAEPVVREILGRLGRERQLQRLIDALDSDRVAQADGGSWLVFPDPMQVNASLVARALETTLVAHHPGWKLVHTVKHALESSPTGSRGAWVLVVNLVKALCGPVPLQWQIEMLAYLATSRPPKDSDGGLLFRTLLSCFAEREDFFTQVLPRLELPTQDGNWHASQDVARTEIGVARRHLLISELRPILCVAGDNPVPLMNQVESDLNESPLETLEKYFQPWHGRLPHGAVGAFLSLFGSGLHGVIETLAQQWLGEDVSIDGVRSKLVSPEGHSPCADVSVWISPRVAHGDRVSVVNVLGSRVDMEAHHDDETLFAIDPHRYPQSRYALAPLGEFWEITLRDVEPQSRSSSELIRLLGGTVERWASQYLELDRERVSLWWSQWGKHSQADLGPVLASIKAHLPLTLQQLDVKESEPLRNALREAEQAQRKREQAPSHETLEIERKAVDGLANLIEAPHHQTFLWQRVNELMRRYGYGPESVLLELAQNADDALAQAAQIKGGPLPSATRQLLIQLHDQDGPTMDVTHWGRPINDNGGPAFPPGRERQWDQDLYFMMLMNLSGKPGEAPGETPSSSTTGRFGLGFKSVHLVSSSPSVISDFIAFSIAGALLPREQAIPDEADSKMIDGRRPTRVRLPLRQDIPAPTLIRQLFSRFAYARVFLPVFARHLQKVTVEGGPFPGVHVFDSKPIKGAPGWSLGITTELPSHVGRWQVLRLRPADAGREDMGTAALAVGIRDGVPAAFRTDVPFLWNVTPTSEAWACGYVVNGPFKLDPGRTHVSLDDDMTLRSAQCLGEALGPALIKLYDVLTNRTEAESGRPIEGDGRDFLSSLWKVLASGIDNPDKLRRTFLLKLHGAGSGISAWMTARSVVPTGLPAPFSPFLPPLNSGSSWEVAVNGLDNPKLCAALDKVNDADFLELMDSCGVVSEETDRLLCPLLNPTGMEANGSRSTPLRPCDLLAGLADRWNYRLIPARLHALRPLSQVLPWNLLTDDPQGAAWRGKLQARAADGSYQPLRTLLLRKTSELGNDVEGDLEDEFLRSALAPDARILDTAYIQRSEDWTIFRWLRMQHRIDAAEIADWYMDLENGQHPAAVCYLLYGELQDRVLSRLIPNNARPPWLRNYDDVRSLLEDLCDESWRRERLLGALFPDRQHAPEEPTPVQPDPRTFFQQLLEWWDDAAVRNEVIAAYEKRAWPEWLRREDISACLQAGSVDHWLALLVLGACQSLGRTQDHQHRRFLELAQENGWWDTFKDPGDIGAWMQMLRAWQDEAKDKLTYPRWMSLFPAIYQLSRYREVYVRLLKSAELRPEGMYQITQLLAPRVDKALTGAGTHFDAPPAPLNMGLHWVLRELVRLRVLDGEHLFPDCWVPSELVLNLLRPLGLILDEGTTNSDKAHDVFDFLAFELETESPNLHLGFDIPLRHVDSNGELRRRFGLEQS